MVESTTSESVKLVSVGCKLPHGLHLDLTSKSGEKTRYTLNGANAARIIGGYGITENIPSEFMTHWLAKNAKRAAVVNGSIFIHSDVDSARAIAKERSANTTGFEAIDPIKAGMLHGPDGEIDKSALAKLNEQRAKNPERNRQIVE